MLTRFKLGLLSFSFSVWLPEVIAKFYLGLLFKLIFNLNRALDLFCLSTVAKGFFSPYLRTFSNLSSQIRRQEKFMILLFCQSLYIKYISSVHALFIEPLISSIYESIFTSFAKTRTLPLLECILHNKEETKQSFLNSDPAKGKGCQQKRWWSCAVLFYLFFLLEATNCFPSQSRCVVARDNTRNDGGHKGASLYIYTHNYNICIECHIVPQSV